MNRDQKIIYCINNNNYAIDNELGKIYRYRKNKGEYIEVKPSNINGYKQVILFGGRHTGVKISAYVHRIIYLCYYWKINHNINHIDGNPENNALKNL